MFDFSVERFTKMLKLMSLRHKSAALPKAAPTAKRCESTVRMAQYRAHRKLRNKMARRSRRVNRLRAA